MATHDEWSKLAEPDSLEEIAAQANRHHAVVMDGMRTGIQAAYAAGKCLEAAHARVPKGRWQEWVRNNFAASYETCCVYRRIARPENWEVIQRYFGSRYSPGVWNPKKQQHQGSRLLRGRPMTLEAARRIMRSEQASEGRLDRAVDAGEDRYGPTRAEWARDELKKRFSGVVRRHRAENVVSWVEGGVDRFEIGLIQLLEHPPSDRPPVPPPGHRFLDPVRESVLEALSVLDPVARETIEALWAVEDRRDELAADPDDLADEFRKSLSLKFHGRKGLTARQEEAILVLVKPELYV